MFQCGETKRFADRTRIIRRLSVHERPVFFSGGFQSLQSPLHFSRTDLDVACEFHSRSHQFLRHVQLRSRFQLVHGGRHRGGILLCKIGLSSRSMRNSHSPGPPCFLTRLIEYGQGLAVEQQVPLLGLHQRAHGCEPSLSVGSGEVIHLRSFARILLEPKQLARGFHRFIELAIHGINVRKIVDVMPVMSAAIDRIGSHVATLIHGCIAERLLGFFQFAGLPVDVPRHVYRVRNVRNQFRVALATWPRIAREVGTLKSVNHEMMDARVFRRVVQKFAEQTHSFHAARPRSFLRPPESAHDVESEVQFRLDFPRIFRQDCAQTANVGVVRVMHRRQPPAHYRGDVHLLKLTRLPRNGGQFLRAFRGFDRTRIGAWHQLADHNV